MTILESISQKTSKILRVILTIDITLIAVLAFAQVIFRYILNWPGHFIDELISLCAVWLYFMGSVNASVEGLYKTRHKPLILLVFCRVPLSFCRLFVA